MNNRFLLFILLCMPFTAMAEDYNINELAADISNSATISDAVRTYNDAFILISDSYETKVERATIQTERDTVNENIKNALNYGSEPDTSTQQEPSATPAPPIDESPAPQSDTRSAEEKEKALREKNQAYEDAKSAEQSLANRTLTATTTAATGIGGMELAMGLSEQSADKNAAADMASYIATMRCTYANGSQVQAGPAEIELPGVNGTQMAQLRAEYIALAADLRERKEALGIKPGIESETIMDKSEMGLYDDENIGITNGNYESLYRAQMLSSDADQAKIDENANASKNRVMGGAIAAGAGTVIGVVGNSLINGKLGELIKSNKAKRNAKSSASIDRNEAIKTLTETELNNIKNKYFSDEE